MKPSKYHANVNATNWLVYKQSDRFLEKYSSLYNGTLVDLGCGDAPFRKYFLQYARCYIGVDWTKTLHNSKADIVSDLNTKVALDDDLADTVVGLSVLEHLYNPQQFLNEAHRVLKKEGSLILQVPWQWQVHEAPFDYFRYTPYGLKYLLSNAGFINIKIEASSGLFSTIALKLNYFSARFIIGPWLIRMVIRLILLPFWTLNQLFAQLLDKLDRNKSAESQGFFVTARKG